MATSEQNDQSTMSTGRKPGLLPLLCVDAEAALPLYEQLFRELRRAVVDGDLKPGQRLASARQLASELQLSRATVVAALERLHAEGYLYARHGAGTFVVDTLPDRLIRARRSREPVRAPPVQTPRLSHRGELLRDLVISGPRYPSGRPRPFHPRRPPVDLFPTREWARLIRREWASAQRWHLDYGDPRGLAALREVIATQLGPMRGVECDASQVVITNGSQQAFDLLFKLLLDPGDRAWLEEPGPMEARAALLAAGAKIVPVPVDRDGIDVAAGRACAADARVAVVSPSHQYPTGATLAASRRTALLDWAASARAWIVEDDYDSYFRYRGRPMSSMFALNYAQGKAKSSAGVAYVGTFSKTMFPSLRLGYCIVPPSVADAVANLRAIADRNSPLATQAALADFIADGHYDRHLRRVRTACQERYEALRFHFGRVFGHTEMIEAASAGMHVLAWRERAPRDAAQPSRAVTIANAAADDGLVLFPLSRYHLVAHDEDALVLGYGAQPPDTIATAVEALARVFDRVDRPVRKQRR